MNREQFKSSRAIARRDGVVIPTDAQVKAVLDEADAEGIMVQGDEDDDSVYRLSVGSGYRLAYAVLNAKEGNEEERA